MDALIQSKDAKTYVLALFDLYSFYYIANFVGGRYGRFAGFFCLLAQVLYFVYMTERGDGLVAFLYGYRDYYTSEEVNIIHFNEVLEAYLDKRGAYARRGIKFYIDDSMTVNAYSMGLRSLIITRGALATFSSEELRGVIAHEIAHLDGYDTMYNQVVTLCNPLRTLLLYIIKGLEMLTKKLFPNKETTLIGGSIKFVLKTVSGTLLLIFQILMMYGSRKREVRADAIAEQYGYGQELLSALYTLSRITQPEERPSIIDRLKEGHPSIFWRIHCLEERLKICNQPH